MYGDTYRRLDSIRDVQSVSLQLAHAHFYPTSLSRTIPHFQFSNNYFVTENVFREVHFVSKEC